QPVRACTWRMKAAASAMKVSRLPSWSWLLQPWPRWSSARMRQCGCSSRASGTQLRAQPERPCNATRNSPSPPKSRYESSVPSRVKVWRVIMAACLCSSFPGAARGGGWSSVRQQLSILAQPHQAAFDHAGIDTAIGVAVGLLQDVEHRQVLLGGVGIDMRRHAAADRFLDLQHRHADAQAFADPVAFGPGGKALQQQVGAQAAPVEHVAAGMAAEILQRGGVLDR